MDLVTPSKHHRTVNGAELVRLREDMGFSQAALADRVAEKMGIKTLSRQYIAQIEGVGENGDFTHEVRTTFADAVALAVCK